MTSPVETIADALIAFILSLLRDPDAAAGFAADPDSALADNNLQGACMSDLAAVRPVIVDRPDVVTRAQVEPMPPVPNTHTEVTNEIMRIVQQFSTTIDARSTIVDQSVNQSIWTAGGDVTQHFDQEAIIASGDGSVAAGDDASVEDTDMDLSVGDVSIGNETYDDSFNNAGAEDVTPAPDAPAPAAPAPAAPAPATAPPADAPAGVVEPADVLETDMTATDDSYEADAASAAAASEAVLDEPLEEE